MKIQDIVYVAKQLKLEGRLDEALKAYSEAFDLLVKEAHEYARVHEGAVVGIEATRKITPVLFEKAKQYLKQDKIAAVISNNMGVIFAQQENFDSAKKFFEQAIELTPNNLS